MDLSDLDIPFDAENKAQSQDKNNSANALVVMSADPVEMLTARLSNVLTENHDLQARVKALEDRMQSVLYMLNTEKERDRGTIRPPFSGSFGNPPSVSEKLVTNIDEDASETVQTPSMICFPTEESFSRNLVDMPMYRATSVSGTTKLSSATSAMGYTNEKSVWGAALSSMLIAMVRYYCIRTGTDNISLDEGKIMKTCIYLAPILYEMSHKSLPAVKSPTTKYMSSSISKVGSNGVPQSTAESWYQMTATQDGRDCLKVIKTMIKNAKKMPEVLSHPLSDIVSYVLFPVVKKREDGSACFRISNKIKLRNSPGQWEVWCSLLKSSALIRYAMWRAYGDSAATSAANMMSDMKITELSSATSAMGYTNAKSVWGAALSSMLIAMVRYYCIRTGTDNISLDEGKIMKTCIYLAPILYEMSHESLPAVKSPTTKYMSSSISKVGSNGVPQSTAESWYQMTATQDGKDCLKVMETMIRNAKKMPEVLSHPLSNIVPYVLFPVVKKREDGSACFRISNKIKLRNSPDQREVWCSLLKSSALIKYAMWRAYGDSAATSAANMMSYIRITELVDKENLDKFKLT
ncbi:hypothetical protein E4U35_006818 [Claviceps purpurea]|nr:hypothetical protein E4U10_008301 [Claviceps purpurea]KAG6209679.1 hypothetical protein E4U35_006818 [Claviceps purpurea]